VIAVVQIVVGLLLLIKGADLLVDGAAALARRMNVSDLAIGLTVVAFGTSMPELVVSVIAGVRGDTELAIGNVLGSNIANIFMIMGIAAVIRPLNVTSETVWREIPMACLTMFVLALLANDRLLDGSPISVLSRSDGLVLLCFFAIFIYYTVSGALQVAGAADFAPHHPWPAGRALGWTALGLAGLLAGGHWIVSGAVQLSRWLGVGEALVGLTVVAVGTSLPELATSIAAVRKGNADIAMGNVVGSNIFNVLLILGVSAVIRPLPFAPERNIDLGVALLASLLLFTAMFTGRRYRVDRWEGALFCVLYAAYLGLLIVKAF
jgi:cation:H+ antiporter